MGDLTTRVATVGGAVVLGGAAVLGIEALTASAGITAGITADTAPGRAAVTGEPDPAHARTPCPIPGRR